MVALGSSRRRRPLCPRSSGACAALALSLALALSSAHAAAAGTPIYEATPAELKSAQQTFAAGNRLYDAREFAHAITAFRASHDIVASPNSSLMIARCYRELGKLREAVLSFREALAEASAAAARDKRKYGSTLDAVQSELADLDPVVGRITIELVNAPDGTKVSIGDEPIAESALTEALPVAPGTIKVNAIAPSGASVSRDVSVAASQSVAVKLEFEAAPDETEPKPEPTPRAEPPPQQHSASGPPRVLAYVAGGIGAAGLVTFGIFGAMSNATFSALEEECLDDHCPPDKGSDIDSGRTQQTVANIGLAVGIVGIGTGVALYLLSEPSTSEREQSKRPQLGVGWRSIHVEGRF
jgi:hypothetical protein